MNREYFDGLKRKYQTGELHSQTVKVSLLNPPEGERIVAWLDQPIQSGPRNIYPMEKLDE